MFPLLALTQIGGRYSSIKEFTSTIGKTKRFLMLKEVKTEKDKLFGPGENTVVQTRNGISYILKT
jgi:Tfp pilus assembly protein PilO